MTVDGPSLLVRAALVAAACSTAAAFQCGMPRPPLRRGGAALRSAVTSPGAVADRNLDKVTELFAKRSSARGPLPPAETAELLEALAGLRGEVVNYQRRVGAEGFAGEDGSANVPESDRTSEYGPTKLGAENVAKTSSYFVDGMADMTIEEYREAMDKKVKLTTEARRAAGMVGGQSVTDYNKSLEPKSDRPSWVDSVSRDGK